MRTALTVAGSDSSGGAGIQADLKTFAAHGVFGLSAITAVTAQNTCGVKAVRRLDTEIITAQIAALYEDIVVHAVKVGMLADAGIVRAVADALGKYRAVNIVVDPVMISKNGRRLLLPEAVKALTARLFPLAEVVTPNLDEASEIVGFEVADLAGMKRAAAALKALGPRYVVVKGGHLPGAACDLIYDGRDFTVLSQERINSVHTHGTGCTFSSAIAAGLARGLSVQEALINAKLYITTAITHGIALGKGAGPTHHFYDLYRRADMLQDRGD